MGPPPKVPREITLGELQNIGKRIHRYKNAATPKFWQNVTLPVKGLLEIHTPTREDKVFHVIRVYSQIVRRLLEQNNISPGEREPHDYEVIVREATKNIIAHAHKPQPGRPMVMFWSLKRFRRKSGRRPHYEIELHFRDHGTGLPETTRQRVIQNKADVDALSNDEADMFGGVSGLRMGLSLIKELSDYYEHRTRTKYYGGKRQTHHTLIVKKTYVGVD